MSDSFADLWNSSVSTKPPQPPQRLGSATASHIGASNRRPTYDAFSLLASSGPASASPRPVTPSAASLSNQRTTPKPGPSKGTEGDAFSELLSGTFTGTSGHANLSMAERASRAERERSAALLRQQQESRLQAAAWDGLDSLAQGSALSAPPPQSSVSSPPDDDWLFGAVVPNKGLTQPAPSAIVDDDWGLTGFSSPPAVKTTSPTAHPRSLWDLDSLDSSSQSHGIADPSRHSPAPRPPQTTPLGDFDFGNREDGIIEDDSSDDDDILGQLAKPADAVVNSQPPLAHLPHRNGHRTGASSPPPHVIGQIVEMGFSPQQARVALAATDTGLDVQAALETLLSNGAGATDDSAEPPEVRPRRRERPADRYGDADSQDSPPHQSSRPEMPRRPSARTRPSQEPPEANYQQHADKLIAQASEIGLTMFNRANALWNQSKEKVQKAYEERAVAARSGSANRPISDGRPKWMQDSLDVEESGRQRGSGSRTESIYDDNVEGPPSRRSKQRPIAQDRPQPHVDTEDLLSDDAPKAYVSPFRRGKPPAAAPSPPAYKAAPPRTPSPIRLVQRRTISATPSAIAASAKYKATGTESFKLGQFAEAESAYSSAISQLPDSHILLIPLLNNRALTRLKTGNTSGAIEDCTTVISVIGPSYHPSREAKLTKEDEGASVDLADALVKAWKRRAEAYEGREKWDLARKDWETIAGVDFAGRLRSEAVNGAARCRKMLISDPGDGSGTSARPSPPPAKVPRRPPQKRPTPPSAALNRLQQANKAAEAEDDARYELKDSIDARLAAWKQGKETNLRALIASLDTVLWPELGWQKVGMAELVTPNQVKIRYTKAIAKLHPDKLNVKNTTLEQRMIANGVFGSLNDAWNAFKP